MKTDSTTNNLADRCGRLAGLFLEKISAQDRDANCVLSPFSVLTLLAIAADATGGKTKEEITTLLCGGMSFAKFLEQLKACTRMLTAEDTFLSANAVIVKDSIKNTIDPAYNSHIAAQFGGELISSKNIVADVNAWVDRQTKGRITGIADRSMEEMLLCLLNACTFTADWKEQYKDHQIRDHDFHNSDGTTVEVKMLGSCESVYIETDAFTGFTKPYKGGRFAFLALLPKEDVPVSGELLRSIDFASCLRGRENTLADVLLPEFRYSSDYNITDICRALGISTVFTPYADFSPLSSEWLKAEGLKHKAYIEVDRKGTRAAAVTMMSGFAGALPDDFPEFKEVILDRPFFYAIVDTELGIPVFTGIVNHLDPSMAGESFRMMVKYLPGKTFVDPCTGEVEVPELTPGKEYPVLSVEEGWYRIMDDDGIFCLYPSEMFKIVEKKKRRRRLDRQ